MHGHSVHDAAHAMLANSKMEIATAVIAAFQTRSALDDRIRRRRKIRRSADELWNFRRDCVQHRSRRCPTRDTSVVGGERRDELLPSIAQVAAQPSLELCCVGRVRCFPRIVLLLPFPFELIPAWRHRAPVIQRFRSDIERLL